MFDIKKIFGLAGKIEDMASDAITAAKNQAASMTLPPGFENMLAQVKQMLADGKITKEEIIEKIKPLAAAKGIPVSAIETALNMLMKK